MKTLSIKQPWSWLICAGVKDIENRDWPIGHRLSLPCRIYVHAGKTPDLTEPKSRYPFTVWAEVLIFGAIIGEVTITACVTKSQSPWFAGKYGFVLTAPKLYSEPIPYRGQLGFFEVPDSLRKE